MVNLPLKKDFSPITSRVPSLVAIMNDMQHQETTLAKVIGGIDSTVNNFSDDLVTVSNKFTQINSVTSDVTKHLNAQKSILTSLQTTASSGTQKLISTLNSEVGQLQNVASKITDHVNELSSTVTKGLNLGTLPSDVSKQIKTLSSNFSSSANKLVSGLNDHISSLKSVISSSEKSISGIITKSPAGGALKSVQDIAKSGNVSDLESKLTSIVDSADISTVVRQTEQKFTEISDQVKGTLDNLKSSVVASITAKVSNATDLKSITHDLDGAIDSATSGLNKLSGSISQLGDLSSKVNELSSGVTDSLQSVATQATESFKSQLGQINDLTTKMESLGNDIDGHIKDFSNTINSSIQNVGGMSSLTGAVGGVNSLTDIVSPSKVLSSSITDMNNLSHDLILKASSLEQFAVGLPSGNPISELTTKLTNIGKGLYQQTSGTPEPLLTLADVTSEPHLNIGSFEKSIVNAGKDLTQQISPAVSLNINVEKLTSSLTSQILSISNDINSVPES